MAAVDGGNMGAIVDLSSKRILIDYLTSRSSPRGVASRPFLDSPSIARPRSRKCIERPASRMWSSSLTWRPPADWTARPIRVAICFRSLRDESAQPRGRLSAFYALRTLAPAKAVTRGPSSARRGALPKIGRPATQLLGAPAGRFKPKPVRLRRYPLSFGINSLE